MKKIFFVSLLIWILLINTQKIWPLSKGERYYQNLQKWYLQVNRGDWEKGKIIENKLKKEDTQNFIKENKEEELRKKLNQIIIQKQKTADDWMEIAVLFYRLNNKNKAYEAIESAYRLDPIREDVSKIFFTFGFDPQPTLQPL